MSLGQPFSSLVGAGLFFLVPPDRKVRFKSEKTTKLFSSEQVGRQQGGVCGVINHGQQLPVNQSDVGTSNEAMSTNLG